MISFAIKKLGVHSGYRSVPLHSKSCYFHHFTKTPWEIVTDYELLVNMMMVMMMKIMMTEQSPHICLPISTEACHQISVPCNFLTLYSLISSLIQ